MNKKEFDRIIRNNLVKVYGESAFGYQSATVTKKYEDYYSKPEFDKFTTEMRINTPEVYKQYFKGKGSELKEHSRGDVMLPPKMASVASSSRFAYLALSKGADALIKSGIAEFEKGCCICGISGTAPQLDAYIKEGGIYVEVKCHEIFDKHTIKLKDKYWTHIYENGNKFGLESNGKPTEEYFEIPNKVFGVEKEYTMFDIKQFICHLLGVSCQKEPSSTLMYLFFKPVSDNADEQKEINKLFDELKKEISDIFNSYPVQNFINANNITLKAIAEESYTMETLNASNIVKLF